MKAAIYYKISAEDEHPEKQRADLENYAKRMGYEYEVFEEKESARGGRPVKHDLLKRLRAKEFDGLVVWNLDRWAKNLSELIPEIKDLLNKQLFFISLKDGIDLSDKNARQVFYVASAFTEFERASVSERVKLGLERAKRAGKKLGRPFGSLDRHGRRKPGYLV
jgi:DNA invertase Pin-like site-specific DNA recombinase